jgi:hypothetical protein
MNHFLTALGAGENLLLAAKAKYTIILRQISSQFQEKR